MKLVQDLLGHTTSSFTCDTYQGVADEARRVAANTRAAFLAQADKTPGDNAVQPDGEPDPVEEPGPMPGRDGMR